jgi:hypothetical protein
MTQNLAGYLPEMLGPHSVIVNGGATAVTSRAIWNFIGPTLTDDAVNERTDFDFGAFASSTLRVANPAGTFWVTIAGSAWVADRVLTIPLLTGPDTVCVLGLAQTLALKTLTAPVLAGPTITGTVVYQGTKLRILSIPGEVQTTTATTAVIATFTMLDETSCKFDFTASMKAVGVVAKAGGWTGSATYYRTGGGAPTISNGTPNYGTAEETTAGDGVTFDVSGNAVRVLATAADADDRNWTCEFRVAETLATA